MQRHSQLLLLCTLLFAGCQPESELSLLDEDEAEWEERRRRMDITILRPSGEGWGAPEEVTTQQFTTELQAHCLSLVQQTPQFAGCNTTIDSCTKEVCNAHLQICMANLYLELSRTVEPVEIQGATGAVLVPPQRTSTNAGLSEAALAASMQAVTRAGENLRYSADATFPAGPPTKCSSPASLTPTIYAEDKTTPAETYGESLAAILVEGTQLARRAAEFGLRDNSAVADTDLATAADRGRAWRAAWVAPVLSRLHGMQLFTGGSGYLNDSTRPASFIPIAQTGVCANACGPRCQDALDMMRDGGMSLTDLANLSLSTDSIIQGTGLSVPGGLAARLAERYQSQEVATLAPQDFLHRFGISSTDFSQARTFLRAEASFFDRNPSVQAPRPIMTTSNPLGAPVVSQYAYFAATVNEPHATPPMFHISMARANQQYVDDRYTGTNTPASESARPTSAYALRGATQLFDYAQSVAQFVVSKNTLPSSVSDIAGVMLAQRVLTNSVRVENCYRYYQGQDQLRIRVHGADDVSSLVIVNGTDGLSCAETGFVEGQPCDLTQYIVPNVSVTYANHSDYGVGFDRYVQLQKNDLVYPQPFRYYVVRRREGSANGSGGNWESLASVTTNYWGASSEIWRFCHNEAYDAVVTRQASLAMTVDPAQCEQGPANDCYGAPRNGPLPLEDELIEDSDPYENSFRHHLRVAREAADYSDELGRQLIEAGLRIDDQAETSMRQLATLCGGEFNLDGLFNTDGTLESPTLEQIVNGTCTTTCANPGYRCIGGYCILDMIADAALSEADALALAECLGGDETMDPYVILGSDPLCLWRDSTPGSENLLCNGATEAVPCAGPIPAAGCPTPPTDNTAILPSEQTLLGLFGTSGAAGQLLGTAYVAPMDCADIRLARTTTDPAVRRAAIDRIVSSNFFSIENVRLWASRIGWRGYPLNFSELTIDGGRWHGTGNPFPNLGGSGIATTDWPCTAAPGISCAGYPTSLFCSTATCSEEYSRAAVNDRMARAAIVLGTMSGYGLGNVRIPVRYGSAADEVDFLNGEMLGRATIPDYNAVPVLWRIATTGNWEGTNFSGLVTIPLSATPPVWTRPATAALPSLDATSSIDWPVAFINFGGAQRDEAAARRTTEAFWTGMSQGDGPTLVDAWGVCRDFGVTVDGFCHERGELVGIGNAQTGFFRLALDGQAARLAGVSQAGRNGWFTDYWREPVAAINAEPGGGTQFRDNLLLPAREGFGARDALDALELMCEAARAAQEQDFCDPSRPPTIQTTADIPQLRAYLNCIANRVDHIGDRLILQNVPHRVVQMIRDEPVPIRPDEGAYGTSVIRLRDSLRNLGALPSAIAAQIRGFSDDLELLAIALDGVEARRELEDLGMVSGAIERASACVASTSSVSPGAAATCANAAAQTVIAFRVNEINQELLDDAQRELLIQFRGNFADRQQLLNDLGRQIAAAADDANIALNGLRSTRREAEWSLAGALFATSEEGRAHSSVNTVYRRQYNTLRQRYLEAHQAAVRYAVLARRALEQRLGTDLNSLTDLTLVDDPSTWPDVCESTGINYGAIRREDADFGELDSYAGEFIGDYVRRLERVLESYRLDYPYTSAGDTAVVSIRDDLWTIREQCPAPTFNLLASSGDLEQTSELLPNGELYSDPETPPLPAWGAAGCVGAEPFENCVTAQAVTSNPVEVDAIVPGHRPLGYRVTFGAGASFDPNTVDWGQSLPLAAGMYRLSWYGRCIGDSVNRDPRAALSLTVHNGATPVTVTSSTTFPEVVADCSVWTRYFRFVEFGLDGTARIRIEPAHTTTRHSVDITAVQLEFVGDRVFDDPQMLDQADVDGNVARYYPRPFVSTTSFGTAELHTCADEDGDRFRRRWSYDCLPLCVAGFGECGTEEDGSAELGTTHCYWQTEIQLDLERLEQRAILPNGGFAVGNFNYRIEQVGLNFVGTGTRDCSAVGAPGTCHGAGFIPYSIEHVPVWPSAGYAVRNYAGEDYPARLFTGRIEHARGLAAERYLTNPLSSSDQSLIGSYLRGELRGRPLTARFVVRVWDEPGVSFHNIEDVQLVLGYRYLTRTPAP